MKRINFLILAVCLLVVSSFCQQTSVSAKEYIDTSINTDAYMPDGEGFKFNGVTDVKYERSVYVSCDINHGNSSMKYDVDNDGSLEKISIKVKAVKKNGKNCLSLVVKNGSKKLLGKVSKPYAECFSISFVSLKNRVYMSVIEGDNDLADGEMNIYLINNGKSAKKVLTEKSNGGWDYLTHLAVAVDKKTGKESLYVFRFMQCNKDENYNQLSKSAKKAYANKLSKRYSPYSVRKYTAKKYKLSNGKLKLVKKENMYKLGYAAD